MSKFASFFYVTLIFGLMGITGCSLQVGARDDLKSEEIPTARRIGKEFPDTLDKFERSWFEKIQDKSRTVQGANSMYSRAQYYTGELIATGKSDPEDRLKYVLNTLVKEMARYDMGLRHGGEVYSFEKDDSVEPMTYSLDLKGGGYYGGCRFNCSPISGPNRYVNILLSFGHQENLTFHYTWHMTYDMKLNQLYLSTYLYYVEPVPNLGISFIRKGEFI